MKATLEDRIFDTVTTFFLVLFGLVCVLPFLNIASIAMSSNAPILQGRVTIYPIGLQWDSFKVVFNDRTIWQSFYFTATLTVVYTFLSMLATICTAYPLTKKHLKGRNVFLFFILFTMYFHGGLIPTYLVVKNVGLLNSIWALILPCVISTWNMIIMKSFFQSIPESLEESARIDGANDLIILFRIVLPLSVPVLAALSLFYAVFRWNTFQDAIFYINDPKKYPLQILLRQIVMRGETNQMMTELDVESIQNTPESLRAATLIFVITPILMVYPFLQKYFISGIMLGSIKE